MFYCVGNGDNPFLTILYNMIKCFWGDIGVFYKKSSTFGAMKPKTN